VTLTLHVTVCFPLSPLLVALNPTVSLPSQPIEVVFRTEPSVTNRQFAKVAGENDPYFASTIPYSFVPPWPTSRYKKFKPITGINGPASYVADKPYSMSFTLAAIALKLGAKMALMVNDAGFPVRASFQSIAAAQNERIVTSTRNSTGHVVYSFNYELSKPPGPRSWPIILPITLIMPQLYVGGTCVENSELVKLLSSAKQDMAAQCSPAV
jgi:hypothetical protein